MWVGLSLSQMFSLSFLKHKIQFYWSNRVNDEVFGGGLGLSLTIALLLLSFVITYVHFVDVPFVWLIGTVLALLD